MDHSRNRPRKGLNGFGLVLAFVVIMILLVMVLLLSHSFSATTVGREQHLTFLGAHCRMACDNALQEAYLHFLLLANTPGPSRRVDVDLYEAIRKAQPGDEVAFAFPPTMARRLLLKPPVTIGNVQVRLALTNVLPPDDRTGPGLWKPRPEWEPPSGWSPPPGYLEARLLPPFERLREVRRREGTPWLAPRPPAPDIVLEANPWRGYRVHPLVPRIVAVAVVRFRVRAAMRGPRATVWRSIETRKIVKLAEAVEVEKPLPGLILKLVYLAPNSILRAVHRGLTPQAPPIVVAREGPR